MANEHSYLQTEGDLNFSESREKWYQKNIDSATQEVLNNDSDYFLHQALSTPCLDVIDSASGIRINSLSGKSYIDFHGNNVHQLGYQNAYIIDQVKAQLDKLTFCPRRYTNLPSIRLAERLAEATNHTLSRVLFAPGGTSAISMALKLARIYTGKFKTIAMYDSFHGASMDSISLGGEYVFQQGLGPLMAGSIHVPPVDTYRGMWLDSTHKEAVDLAYANYLEYVIKKEGDVGILVAETIRSTTVHVPSKAYWKRVREICDQYGVLLAFDEIPIGMGRTGKMFAYQHFDVEPDILILGKGLGAGILPMAAIVCKDHLNVAKQVSLGHFTHEKNPLGAAAALAAFEYMEQNHTLQHVDETDVWMKKWLKDLQQRYHIIGDVRGIGLLWGIELVEDRNSKSKNIKAADLVLYKCLELGLSLKVSDGSVLCLYPPLIITIPELEEALAILEEAIAYAMAKLGLS